MDLKDSNVMVILGRFLFILNHWKSRKVGTQVNVLYIQQEGKTWKLEGNWIQTRLTSVI